jgi:alpha-amylase
MPNRLRFLLVLHDHQPVGNFDHVFEQAYQDSYRPFLDVFQRYDSLKMALHTSGSLMQWLDRHHPEYVDRLAELVAQGRIEVVGGARFEPILAMIPSHDRIGQVRSYTRWLEDRLGGTVRGAWMPERVWEQSFTRDLVDAGIEYTVLDDFHFKKAGLTESQLSGYFVTEDEGRLLTIFPGSERLRYTIPFGTPEETIAYLGEIAEREPNAVIVFGDDGEKFGTWPETKKHVYGDRWLERFFDALVANQEWIHVTTPSEAIDNVPPAGKIFLPDCSYREMTEWSLPAEQLVEYERLAHEMEDHPQWESLKQFIRGGYWRNYRVKYSEAEEMYARMMAVSGRVQSLAGPAESDALDEARMELYRGQCNCSYWHGAFGGIYLPHLRNAVYNHLIRAENLLDRAAGRQGPWVDAADDDYNFDGRQEIQLANDKLLAMIAPHRGGQIYELDVRSICHNLLATMTRRPEAYHRKVLAGANNGQGECASIHDRVVFKQEGLDRAVQYDDYLRNGLIDLFYENETTLEAVASGNARQGGDFVEAPYEARLRRNPDRIQVQMIRQGRAFDTDVQITKGVTLNAGSNTLEIAYLLEGLPQDRPLHFAVEMNCAGLPAGADDRYFRTLGGEHLGQLGAWLDLHEVDGLGLVDQWLGIDVALQASRPTHFWTFPIATVSQSEGGFELVHQSVAVLPHWYVTPDAEGRWSVTMQLAIDTSQAESRMQPAEAMAVG